MVGLPAFSASTPLSASDVLPHGYCFSGLVGEVAQDSPRGFPSTTYRNDSGSRGLPPQGVRCASHESFVISPAEEQHSEINAPMLLVLVASSGVQLF